jgi:IMP dehydrogenase
VADAIDLITKRSHGALIVVENEIPVGIVTEADCENVDRFTQLNKIMSKDLVSLKDDVTPEEAFEYLTEQRRRLAPVINKDGKLVGIITRTGALRATMYQPAVDVNGKLKVAAAVDINGVSVNKVIYKSGIIQKENIKSTYTSTHQRNGVLVNYLIKTILQLLML